MNSKKKNFIISQAIVVVFVLLLTLGLNYFLITQFGFTQETFPFIILVLLIFGVFLFFLLSKPLLEPLFKSDENLQKALKETIHELNIPVSTIKLNTKMLEKSVKEEKNLKRLSRIEHASNNLLELYEQMEYSIKKEIDKVDLQECSLQTLIDESLSKFEDIKGSIRIEQNVQDKLLSTDKKGFIKLLDNLLSNAIKYNKENGIIQIQSEAEFLSIYNTGNSIDTENLILVFDQYYQENSSKEGFGLGLNIVKEFCDQHSIGIKIIPSNSGTTVQLNLKNLLT